MFYGFLVHVSVNLPFCPMDVFWGIGSEFLGKGTLGNSGES